MLLLTQTATVVSTHSPVNQDAGIDQIKADRMKVKADRAKETQRSA